MKVTQAIILSGLFGLLLCTSSVQSAVVDQVVTSGQFGQVSANNGGAVGWANATVSLDGEGINQTAHLFHVSNSPSTGYQFWTGNIPVSAVKRTGVASISVDIDTCSVSNNAGCGYVNFTVTTDQPASGWIDNGVRKYDWDGYIYREAGARQVRFSSSTGTVNGVPVNSNRAFMGKYNEVTISISTPD